MANHIEKLKAGLIAPLAVITGLGATGCSEFTPEAERYPTIPTAVGLEVCDDARVRETPTVDKTEPNLRGTVDYGDAPDDTCLNIFIKDGEMLYQHDDPNNGPWYGIVESVFKEHLAVDGLRDDDSNVVWINSAKATVIRGDNVSIVDTPTYPSEDN